jgi:hypothetical protein
VIPVVGEPRDTAPALELSLGEKHYRRSELPWSDAGSLAARVRLAVAGERLAITVDVRKADGLVFAPPRERNDLDNEPPDINSDGLQIHLAPSDPHAAVTSWLLVPESGTNGVRVSGAREAPRIDATWEPTASGYRVRTFIPLTDAMRHDGFDLDLIVNEMSADRERRRGQLVLSGGGDWIYLRGDRQSREALLPFVVENGTP